VARTPSASAHQKVLKAALELFAERGIEGASMDAIAETSGVSKATIYKHWHDKEALLLELMATVIGLRPRPKFDSGNTRRDMVEVLAFRPRENTEVQERIMPHFIAYSARNHEFGMAWRNMAMQPPRRELTHLIRLGIKKRELSQKLDLDVALALLLGPMLYWHIFLRKTSGNPRRLAEGVVDVFWRAYGRGRPQPLHAALANDYYENCGHVPDAAPISNRCPNEQSSSS
jgi:AcrR family transcriptional regulator